MIVYNSLSITIDQCITCRRRCKIRSNRKAYERKIAQIKKQKGKHVSQSINKVSITAVEEPLKQPNVKKKDNLES